MTNRKTWDEYFMGMAEHAAQRSTCLRRQVGAVAVRDKHVLATGYNGAPMGTPHCLVTGCMREELCIPSGERHELCRAVHAEQNVVAQAALNGISIKGATIYCTTFPCLICAKILVNAGIAAICYKEDYWDGESRLMLSEAKVEVIKI